MNWNAISGLSQLGLFVIAVISYLKPSINPSISYILFGVFILLLLLVLYHKFFRLIRKGKEGGRVFIVNWGVKHWIENPFTLNKLGHTWDEVDAVSEFEFNLYPTGKSINLKSNRL
jgi:hypothetical protein